MPSINLLSFLATVSATYFAMLVYRRATSGNKSRQNAMSLLVLGSLGWWCLCDAFFYGASTVELAWFWHRAGAPGWCGFAAFTAYYFLIMTGDDRRLPRTAKIAFWAVPAALVLCFMALPASPLADALVPSGSGLGWTYVEGFSTAWPYLYLAYALAYLGGALLLLARWARRAADRVSRELARGFIALDVTAVAVGFVALYLVPLAGGYLPPLGFVATMVFGLWYWTRLRDYDFEFVELALKPSYVYESCIDGLVVADEQLVVLYANGEARRVMGATAPVGERFDRYVAPDGRTAFEGLVAAGEQSSGRATLPMGSGVPVVCSVNRTQVNGRFDVLLVHLSDVDQLQRARNELEYLAYHDSMTGVSNRRRLDDLLEHWTRAAEEQGGDFALLFIDIADFKHVNDRFGHAAGDAVLVEVASAIKRVLALGEEVARFAGDEFVVLARPEDEAGTAERLRAAVRAASFEQTAPGLHVDVDVGSCRFSEAGSIDALLVMADSRMYEKKHAR